MTYWIWLAALSALFIILERLWPRDARQGFFRRGLATDVVYIVLNGHWLGVGLALLTEPLSRSLDASLAALPTPSPAAAAAGEGRGGGRRPFAEDQYGTS